MGDVKIALILGTNRKGRESEKVARIIFDHLDRREDVSATLIDVKDFSFPQDDYGRDLAVNYPETQKTIEDMDGYMIVNPEYNHSFPGVLKSFMDMFLKEYSNKAASIATVSSGMWGGTRASENMLSFLRTLGLKTSSMDMHFSMAGDLFNEDGSPKDEGMHGRIDGVLDQLVWLAKSLKWGRENL